MAKKGLIVDLTKPALVEAALKLSRFCMRASQAESYENNTTKFYFQRVQHPTDQLGAIIYDDALQIPIANLKDEDGNWRTKVIAAIQDLIDTLGYTENQAKNFLQNNSSFTFEQIVTPKLPINGVEIKDYATMEAEGWFPIEEA